MCRPNAPFWDNPINYTYIRVIYSNPCTVYWQSGSVKRFLGRRRAIENCSQAYKINDAVPKTTANVY